MRILYCNKYNFPFSGTESYLFETMKLMRQHGHEVALFAMADPRGAATPFDRHFVPLANFKNAEGLVAKTRLAARALYSLDARRRLRGLIAEFRPQIAHVRNIYHHLSPSILWELKAQGIPVLYHLNDFKLLCPSYNFVSHGQACERCRGARFWHVIAEGCYSGPPGSAPLLAAEAYLHKWLGTYAKCVDCFLAPSQFVRQKLAANGWNAGKIEVIPHFQSLAETSPVLAGAPILYFGRLSPEKGVADLLYVMHRLPYLRLRIAGDGPKRAELQELNQKLGLNNVEFSGQLAAQELAHAIRSSCFTVLPSRAYETFGKSILESYAHARAVVATDLGSRRELIEQGKTGLLFPAGDLDRLTAGMAFLADHPRHAEAMGAAGRDLVSRKYAPAEHYSRLLNLYSQLNERKAAGKLHIVPRYKASVATAAGAPGTDAPRQQAARISR
jgi:glycosyltransferase involved in cell wall biosynthesis